MKRVISIIALMVLIMFLFACGSGEQKSEEKVKKAVEKVKEAEPEVAAEVKEGEKAEPEVAAEVKEGEKPEPEEPAEEQKEN